MIRSCPHGWQKRIQEDLAGTKVAAALKEVNDKLEDLYHGVRFIEVISAVYETGLKNGRKDVIDRIDMLKSGIKYLPPGQPKKKKRNG